MDCSVRKTGKLHLIYAECIPQKRAVLFRTMRIVSADNTPYARRVALRDYSCTVHWILRGGLSCCLPRPQMHNPSNPNTNPTNPNPDNPKWFCFG